MSGTVADHGQFPALTRGLAELACETHYDALPASALDVARHALLDWFAVTLGAAREPLTEILIATLTPCSPTDQDAVTIVGHRPCYRPLEAALINGAASHALDFDDVNAAFLGHVSVSVLAAALALAEQRDATGAELLCAYIAGYDTACRVAMAVGPDPYLRGFHQTGTVGALGAAAASARLLALDPPTTAVALGIAASGAAGVRANFGTMTKPLHVGRACQNGLHAAILASRGFTANPAAIEADMGLAAVMGGTCDAAAATQPLEPGSLLLENLFKYHASCFMTHSTLEGIAGAVREHGLTAEHVEGLAIHISALERGTCDIAEPATALEVKFSLSHLAAMALLGRSTAAISDEDAKDPETIAMRAKVTLVEDAAPGPATLVEITTPEGVLRVSSDVSAPERDLALQEQRLTEKFVALATPTIGAQAHGLLAATLGLQPTDGVRGLMQLAAAESAT